MNSPVPRGSCRCSWFLTLTLALLLPALSPARLQAIENAQVEEFNTTTFKDAVNTTADWNTTTGKLTLFPFQPTLLGNYPTPNFAGEVAVSGTMAYVTNGLGLQILDVSNPASPALLGNYTAPGSSRGVAVSGTTAYVTDVIDGLLIVDVSNPASPSLLGSFDTPSTANSVAISGTVAYVAENTSLQIIDVSNPASPTLLGSQSTPGGARLVAVSGTVAYVAGEASGLQIIDVSDPTSPALLGSYDTPDNAYGVAVSGTVAYVADGSSLQIINASNPASPVLLGSYDTPGTAFDVTVSGSVAYVADYASGLQILDVSNPAAPALLAGYDTPGDARDVVVSGTVAYVADNNSGLQILKVGEPVSPFPRGGYKTAQGAWAAAISGSVAYLADGSSGLFVLNVSNAASPSLLGHYDTPGFSMDVAVSGKVAYVADGASGLQVVDISNPASPTPIGTLDTPDQAQGIAVSGTVVYVADGTSLQIIDVSDPANPALLGSYDALFSARDVAVSGTVAYVAEIPGLLIIDVSNPASPSFLGFYDPPSSVLGVAVSATTAYLAEQEFGLHIIDVTDPAVPTALGSYDTPDQANGVAVSGTVAYVADGASGGLQMIDVSNPASPTSLGSYDTPGVAMNVVVAGTTAYVADDNPSGGLRILEVAQNRFDLARNIGRSLTIDGTDDSILRARLSATKVDTVGWELSTDGGGSWQTAIPGDSWIELTPGSDLRWRATLRPTRPYATASTPEASRAEFQWLYAFPVVKAIADISNDQGGQVRITWAPSAYDFLFAVPQIFEYAVYRRTGAEWDSVGASSAITADEYEMFVPTLADSSIAAGQHWTEFRVRAWTDAPGVYYDSYPDSGYSKDNLSPAMPTSFTGVFTVDETRLHWDVSPESDFAAYHLHRGDSADFVPDPGNLVVTQADTGYVDTGSTWSYYKLSALDVNGNQSGFALLIPESHFSAPTPPGNNVAVPLASYANVTFGNVTSGGSTQLDVQAQGTPPPNGFEMVPSSPPLYYDLSTTATFTGSVAVCFTYDPSHATGDENDIKLMHYDTELGPPAWVEVTTSRDTATNTICGTVTHFSEFGLMLQDPRLAVTEEHPSVFRLYPCTPNPVMGRTWIRYDLPVASPVRLALFDLQGRLVRELERHPMLGAGQHRVEWDGRGVRGEKAQVGVYFLRLETLDLPQVLRVVVTR